MKEKTCYDEESAQREEETYDEHYKGLFMDEIPETRKARQKRREQNTTTRQRR